MLSDSYTIVYPPLRGDNPRALASELSKVWMDKEWYNYYTSDFFEITPI